MEIKVDNFSEKGFATIKSWNLNSISSMKKQILLEGDFQSLDPGA